MDFRPDRWEDGKLCANGSLLRYHPDHSDILEHQAAGSSCRANSLGKAESDNLPFQLGREQSPTQMILICMGSATNISSTKAF